MNFALIVSTVTFFFNSPAALAEVLRDARDSMTSMQTVLDRYASLLDSNSPEVQLFQFLSFIVFFLNIKVLWKLVMQINNQLLLRNCGFQSVKA